MAEIELDHIQVDALREISSIAACNAATGISTDESGFKDGGSRKHRGFGRQ